MEVMEVRGGDSAARMMICSNINVREQINSVSVARRPREKIPWQGCIMVDGWMDG